MPLASRRNPHLRAASSRPMMPRTRAPALGRSVPGHSRGACLPPQLDELPSALAQGPAGGRAGRGSPTTLGRHEQGEGGTALPGHHPKRIRICILAPSLDTLGGQSRQAVRLMSGLKAEERLEISFIAHNPRFPGPLALLQRIKYVRTVFTSLAYWLQLVARLWRYDVVHVFSASYFSYLLSVMPAILIGKLYGKKVVLNYRSGEADDHLRRWKLSAVPVMRLADLIVVPSGYLGDVFARFGLAARPIFNVVELDAFRYRERRPIRPVFLTSRLLQPLYNVACVLRAFAIVQAHFPDASLTVAGDGWMRPQLEALARELALRNTRFVGGVAFERMPALYDE